ncbi:hypothetical protein PsorP6_002519 [Peronosclerospora sorghi]|uniref:Uncharacterized protein n=1 Tax=Peronosclerospora sorghi TaxID=230839 RepID=A0ACC0WRZ5_9STRA|nr:hypothetical protein PsorP6_002519 [Peronosclerospora sorghi]
METQASSSGSPVLSYSDNTVIALHHCGGCPNTTINSYKLVNDMRWRGILLGLMNYFTLYSPGFHIIKSGGCGGEGEGEGEGRGAVGNLI